MPGTRSTRPAAAPSGREQYVGVHMERQRVVDGELGAAVDDLDAEALPRERCEAADTAVEPLYLAAEITMEQYPLSGGRDNETEIGAQRVVPGEVSKGVRHWPPLLLRDRRQEPDGAEALDQVELTGHEAEHYDIGRSGSDLDAFRLQCIRNTSIFGLERLLPDPAVLSALSRHWLSGVAPEQVLEAKRRRSR
jgi:hypothetical protein